MDNLTLNAEVLMNTAEAITNYTRNQKQIMLDYLSNIISLIPNWNDDETFSPLLNEIDKLKSDVFSKMEIIESTYPSYFRKKAQSIMNRPVFSSDLSVGDFSNKERVQSCTISDNHLMLNSPISVSGLNNEMCIEDGLNVRDGYVRISSKPRRITELDSVGTFISPKNGKPIVCKAIAWRSIRSVEEANSDNVCGADFYYEDDGTYCGSYVGKSWQDIYDNNVFDTKKFRK